MKTGTRLRARPCFAVCPAGGLRAKGRDFLREEDGKGGERSCGKRTETRAEPGRRKRAGTGIKKSLQSEQAGGGGGQGGAADGEGAGQGLNVNRKNRVLFARNGGMPDDPGFLRSDGNLIRTASVEVQNSRF